MCSHVWAPPPNAPGRQVRHTRRQRHLAEVFYLVVQFDAVPLKIDIAPFQRRHFLAARPGQQQALRVGCEDTPVDLAHGLGFACGFLGFLGLLGIEYVGIHLTQVSPPVDEYRLSPAHPASYYLPEYSPERGRDNAHCPQCHPRPTPRQRRQSCVFKRTSSSVHILLATHRRGQILLVLGYARKEHKPMSGMSAAFRLSASNH